MPRVTCREQHNSPPAASAGGPAAQGRFMPHLRLHDHIVFVFQLQKQYFEFLLFTQICGTHTDQALYQTVLINTMLLIVPS